MFSLQPPLLGYNERCGNPTVIGGCVKNPRAWEKEARESLQAPGPKCLIVSQHLVELPNFGLVGVWFFFFSGILK